MLQTVKNDIKIVEDIAIRISMDTKSIHNRLADIENQPEAERLIAIREIGQNFGLLVEHMANQLNKTATKLNPKKESETASVLKSPIKKVKKSSRSSSSTGSDTTDSEGGSSSLRRISRKTKRRRKLARSRADASNTSSNSEDLPKRIKEEPLVISQDMEDLMNGASNSANESLTRENDLLGFGHVNSMEVDKKTEAMLNSDPAIMSPNTSKPSRKGLNESSANLTASENATPNNSNNSAVNMSTNSALVAMTEEPDDVNDDLIEKDDTEDSDDDEISKLLDFKSIENKRVASTNAEAKLNGIVQAAKKAFKKPAEKEDELAKFLEKNTDDTMESEEENSEQPVQPKAKYTEEQYLKDQNEKLKEQLLQSSSDSDDSMDDSDDMDDRVNGNECRHKFSV